MEHTRPAFAGPTLTEIKLQELLADLEQAERHLLREHRVRLSVDKVTTDGRSAVCSAAQVRRRFLRADHPAEEGVALCHEALSSLYRLGITPLIGWLPRSVSNTFTKLDPKDPFGLRTALYAAGMPYTLRAEGSQDPAIQRSGTHG